MGLKPQLQMKANNSNLKEITVSNDSKCGNVLSQTRQCYEIHRAIQGRKQDLIDDAIQMRLQNVSISRKEALKWIAQKTCCCLVGYLPQLQLVKQHQVNLKIETLTCNKLSHCLFDFDCADFSQYDAEKYEH